MILHALLACGTPGPSAPAPAPPAQQALIPEVQPVAPEAAVIPEVDAHATSGLEAAFISPPGSVASRYDLALAEDRLTFTADPARRARKTAAARSSGFTATPTAAGGRTVRLEGGAITAASWTRQDLGDLLPTEADRHRATAAGFALGETDVLSLTTEDGGTTRFAFRPGAHALLVLCSEVTVVPFDAPTRPVAARKPVVYAYPEQTTELTVSVSPDGPLTAVYPPTEDGTWRVRAHPDGRLEAAERTHRYLFWEAEGAPFTLDPELAHLVERDEAVPFLERVCSSHALTDAECGDFVTYWLPELHAHPYTLVAFPGEAYERWAPLTVEPRPDAVIRLYIVIQGADEPVRVGSPPLPVAERRGFTVVEWGGSALPAR